MKISEYDYKKLIIAKRELEVLKTAIEDSSIYNEYNGNLIIESVGSRVMEAYKALYPDDYEQLAEYKKKEFEENCIKKLHEDVADETIDEAIEEIPWK